MTSREFTTFLWGRDWSLLAGGFFGTWETTHLHFVERIASCMFDFVVSNEKGRWSESVPNILDNFECTWICNVYPHRHWLTHLMPFSRECVFLEHFHQPMLAFHDQKPDSQICLCQICSIVQVQGVVGGSFWKTPIPVGRPPTLLSAGTSSSWAQSSFHCLRWGKGLQGDRRNWMNT